MGIWEPEPPGTLWATPGLLWDCFTLYYYYFFIVIISLSLFNNFLFKYFCLQLLVSQ